MHASAKVLIAFFWSRSGVMLSCALARQTILNWIYGEESTFYFSGVFTARHRIAVHGFSWMSIWSLTDDRYNALRPSV